MYTLDTNSIIYFLKGDEKVRRALIEKFIATPIFVSTITEIELFAYPFLSLEEEIAINSFLSSCLIVPLDSRIARLAASFKRTYKTDFADSAIAATAIATGSALLTRNIKDFNKIQDLKVISI